MTLPVLEGVSLSLLDIEVERVDRKFVGLPLAPVVYLISDEQQTQPQTTNRSLPTT